MEPNDTLQPDHVRTAAEWSMLVNEVSAARLRLEDANARAADWQERYQTLAVEHAQLHVDAAAGRASAEQVVRQTLALLQRARGERARLLEALTHLYAAVCSEAVLSHQSAWPGEVHAAIDEAAAMLTLCQIPF